MGRTITARQSFGPLLPCPDARVEPGRWVRSILQGFIDPRLHSDPAHGADPTRGAEWMSSSMQFCVLHMEKLHTLRGQTRLSVYTHKNAVSDPACGVEPYKFGGAQKAGQTPQSGQVICVYIEGKKAGLTPQSEHCVNAVYLAERLSGLWSFCRNSIPRNKFCGVTLQFPMQIWYDCYAKSCLDNSPPGRFPVIWVLVLINDFTGWNWSWWGVVLGIVVLVGKL